ncbi:MAG: carbohydrate kinase family protein [Candidatus Shapirobacteria bacterium]|jgi:sugar/nucleoside kinase (ribokinase family)|nr:carbohydrate kinase family protein [Candidatus Shapirobacteria bacterium]
MFDVISIGAATTDIFVKSPYLLENKRFLSLKRSSKNEISQSLICSGGGATNSATTFSRLGLKTALVSLIGEDPLAEYIKKDLINEKINRQFLVISQKDRSDFSLILVSLNGTRSILTSRGLTRLESNNIPWDKLKTKWLYLTSLEGNLSLLEELIGFSKENNIKISFNPGLRELQQRRQLLPLLKHLDFLLLNQLEAEILADTDHKNSSFYEKLKLFAPLIAVTNGRLGAKILTPSETLFSPITNTHPIDETGAGDAFGSAFVAGLINNYSLNQCLSWGIHNSASVVSALGAKAGILTIKQISRASKIK